MFFILDGKNHIYYFLKPKMKYKGSYKCFFFLYLYHCNRIGQICSSIQIFIISKAKIFLILYITKIKKTKYGMRYNDHIIKSLLYPSYIFLQNRKFVQL